MDTFDFRAREDWRVPSEIEELGFKVIGAAIEMHRERRPGLSEIHCKKAMSRELTPRASSHALELEFDVFCKGAPNGKGNIDLPAEEKLFVELKTVESLTQLHRVEAMTYLKIKQLPLALLINFNTAILKDGIKRMVNP